jgi:peptidoglycan/xylan/chitin deacetylase (PgdA/CDA1 family)
MRGLGRAKGMVRGLSDRVKAHNWRRRHENFLLIFNWHQVTPEFDPCMHHTHIWTSLNDFEREVAYLASQFKILPLSEALDRLKTNSLLGPCVSLTFDDGDVSNAEHVLPTLEKHNLPATFFINTKYLDGRSSYWFPILAYLNCRHGQRFADLPESLLEEATKLRETRDHSFYCEIRTRVEKLAPLVPNLRSRFVSFEWLTKLDGDQFAIGAHGHEHERFSMMSADWQRSNIASNVRSLSQFKAFRPIFAVPFGRPWDWTYDTIQIARNQGLDVVLANGGINTEPGDYYLRFPSDSRKLLPLITASMAEA